MVCINIHTDSTNLSIRNKGLARSAPQHSTSSPHLLIVLMAQGAPVGERRHKQNVNNAKGGCSSPFTKTSDKSTGIFEAYYLQWWVTLCGHKQSFSTCRLNVGHYWLHRNWNNAEVEYLFQPRFLTAVHTLGMGSFSAASKQNTNVINCL